MSTVLTPKTDLWAELSLYCTVHDFTYIFFYPLSYFTSYFTWGRAHYGTWLFIIFYKESNILWSQLPVSFMSSITKSSFSIDIWSSSEDKHSLKSSSPWREYKPDCWCWCQHAFSLAGLKVWYQAKLLYS